jgi:hypothetical protein
LESDVIDRQTSIIAQPGDLERLVRLLYKGSRPPLVRIFVCGCGRSAGFTGDEADALGWQILPFVQCPACIEREPYQGAEARDRFIKLVDLLIDGKEGV